MTAVPPPPAPIPDDILLGGAPPIDDALVAGPAQAATTTPASADALISLLRLLNVHVQHLWARLDVVRSGAASLDRSAGLIAQAAATIQPLMTALASAADVFPSQADSLARITNAWGAVAASPVLAPPPAAPLDAQAQLKEIALIEGECRTIIYWTAYLTATGRLKEWLETLRPGYAVLFHDIFKDEIPFADDRQQLLRVLAASPQLLSGTGGLVDGETGVVYRYEVDARKRWLSVGWAALALVAATLLVIGAGQLTLLASAGSANLALGWAGALAGVLVHLSVTAAKRLRAGGAGQVVLPVDRLSIDVSAKLGSILLRIGMLLLAYLGLVAGGLIAVDTTRLADFLFSAFLAGYSLDSMIDLLSARLDQQAAAQVNGLKSQAAQ